MDVSVIGHQEKALKVGEDVLLGPAEPVQPGASGEEVKTGLREFGPAFTRKAAVQFLTQAVKIANIGSRVLALRFIDFRTAPVGALLLLRQRDAEQFLDEVLEPVPIGVGPRQLARDLGAVDGSRSDPKVVLDRRKIEPSKMKQLEPGRISKDRRQIGRNVSRARVEANQMLVTASIAYLHQAKAVARGHESHSLGVDGYRAFSDKTEGNIFFVEMNCHKLFALGRLGKAGKGRWPAAGTERSVDGMGREAIPESWHSTLEPVVNTSEARRLGEWLWAEEEAGRTIYPPRGRRLRALDLTPLDQVKVVILGQDPYHGPGQATGLAFSVPGRVPLPPSLMNIYKELEADCGSPRPADGDLTGWAQQGVLLLNSCLTVEAGKPGSHAGRGWERITDACVEAVASRETPSVFILWGKHAQAKAARIPQLSDGRHCVIRSPHPSPLSAHRGFFGSRPFSGANAFLAAHGRQVISWAP